jgi:zona occludens toxin
MIEYILGVPGSGKTYRAVHLLYHTFKVDGKKRHFTNTHFFTNINEFRFDLFPDKGFRFDFDTIYTYISNLYVLSQSGSSDSDLLALARQNRLDNALFIIDECHNIFDKEDAVLIWWLTYHRHLHQNILLLTQNLSLVKAKYKSLTENFYSAVPSSRRFSFFKSKFQYKHYATSRLSKTDYAGTISLDFKQEIYDLYHSGANTQSKNIVMKYVIVASVFFVILILLIIGVRSYWSSKYSTDDVKSDETKKSSPAGVSSLSPASLPSQNYLTVYCDDHSCSNGMPLSFVLSQKIISSSPVLGLVRVQEYNIEVNK